MNLCTSRAKRGGNSAWPGRTEALTDEEGGSRTTLSRSTHTRQGGGASPCSGPNNQRHPFTTGRERVRERGRERERERKRERESEGESEGESERERERGKECEGKQGVALNVGFLGP